MLGQHALGTRARVDTRCPAAGRGLDGKWITDDDAAERRAFFKTLWGMTPKEAAQYVEQLLDSAESLLRDKGLLGKDLYAELLDFALPFIGLDAPAGALAARAHTQRSWWVFTHSAPSLAQATSPCSASSSTCPSSCCATGTT